MDRRSAFTKSIYGGLPAEIFLPHVHDVAQYVYELSYIKPKTYQAHDVFLMFYQEFDVVARSLKRENKAAPAWHRVVAGAVRNPKFVEANSIAARSADLAVVAATKFLTELFKRTGEKIEKAQRPEEAAEEALAAAVAAASEYAEVKTAAASAAAALAGAGGGGLGYSLEGLSVMKFLKEPDEFRKKASILVHALWAFRQFEEAVPASLTHQQAASQYGAVSGVAPIRDLSRIADALPSELAAARLGRGGRLLFALKLVQGQLLGYEKMTEVKPVVFVDKSGSMAAMLGDGVEKISLAAGLALALHVKFGADVYLFDTELEGPVHRAQVVDTLLRIEADGGTDVEPVLKEIMRIGKRERVYVIISDGITEASEELVERFRQSGLARRTKLLLVPPGEERFSWVGLLKQYGNVHYATTAAQFRGNAVHALA
ncbi:MAG: vWA domain-containing protein [Thermoproteus sp.]